MTGVDWTDAVGQAELVRTGAVSPTELVEAAIARIEATDPTIHAVVHERFEQARAEAAGPLPDGPFRGVPFLLKNLTVEIAGYVLDDGMRFLADAGYRSTATDPLGQRFLDAGLVVLGRTNACELGLLPTTEPELHGPTHNPWAPDHTPGGSSGGSAAAVAAGMTAVAHANDGGGSIRIPASCCGLVGLKPTRGRVPSGGSGNEIVNFLVCEGVVTRTVRDAAAMLDVIGAPRTVGPTRAPAPPGTFAGAVGRDPGRLRVGLLAHDPTGGAVDPECVAAVERTAALLEGLGHAVEPSFPAGWSDAEAMLRFSSVWMTETAEGLDHWADVVGRPVTEDDVEPLTWTLARMGRAVTGPDLMLTASRALADAERDAAWWRPAPTDPGPGFDLLLTPTVAEPPVPHGTFPSTRDAPLTGFIRAGAFVPFTTQSNISGQPAISLPLHWAADGRPVGVQLVAAFGREDVLLGVAAQLEAAAPWSDRHPPA